MPSPTRSIRRRRPTAFTLVELMISVALVLILILGVTQVFSLTQKTISATSGLGDAIRSNKAIQQAMVADFRTAALPGTGMGRGGPFLVIQSDRLAAFNNREEQEGDLDYVATSTNPQQIDDAIMTQDTNGNNNEADDLFSRVALSGRNHRVDQISFFIRDRLRRQTGNDGTYAADMTSNEGHVWYGHLKQPDSSNLALAGAMNPGRIATNSTIGTAENNDNNFFARQWILGRFANLLIEPVQVGSEYFVYQSFDRTTGVGQNAQTYIRRNPTGAAASSLQPFVLNSVATRNGTTAETDQFHYGRYDLVGTSIAKYTEDLSTAINPATSGNRYNNWWDVGASGVIFRFGGLPYPSKPMTSEGAARTVPCFIPACTQFAVEYAGDFITQNYDLDNDGQLEAPELLDPHFGAFVRAEPDGIMDFIVVNPGTANVKADIRWYGFPRNVDTSDDNLTTGFETITASSTTRDVVPLCDVAGVIYPFEKAIPATAPCAVPNYGADRAIAYNARYVCAWGPSGSWLDPSGNPASDPPLPKMIRFVVGVDDVDGRLTDTQIYEYVVELP